MHEYLIIVWHNKKLRDTLKFVHTWSHRLVLATHMFSVENNFSMVVFFWRELGWSIDSSKSALFRWRMERQEVEKGREVAWLIGYYTSVNMSEKGLIWRKGGCSYNSKGWWAERYALPLLVMSTESLCVDMTDHLWLLPLPVLVELESLRSFLITSSCGALSDLGRTSRLFGRQYLFGSLCSIGRSISSRAVNLIGCLTAAARVVPSFGIFVLQ